MKRRNFVLSTLPLALTACGGGDGPSYPPFPVPPPPPAPAPPPSTAALAERTMRRAATYMDETVSYRGGYVWAYLPDLSTSWGEMEARRTMCWIQPPGTPTAGHCMLDAYHATGDERFYQAAERTGLALIEAQHPAGGWNYIHDFAGEASLRNWYETVGANGWRLEEFQHYYGNATFDDAGTAVSSQFMLRMYLEKRDARFLAAVQKAIGFVTQAQFAGGVADGGWPQRFPAAPGAISSMPLPNAHLLPSGATAGMEDGDYTRHVTFNDDVAGENIKFLLMCVVALGEQGLLPHIVRAMECLRRMQQSGPQAGWGLQHLATDQGGRAAGAPAGARSYEPRALATHTTQTNVQQLFNYFRLTGDRGYLSRVPEALDWLESCKLTSSMIDENPLLKGRTHPTFVELGTNLPRFVHRYGSNIHNGAYYFDHDHRATLSHYSGGRSIDIAGMRQTLAQLSAMSDAAIVQMVAASPLRPGADTRALPKYFSLREVDFADLFADRVMTTPPVSEADAQAVMDKLDPKGYWLAPLNAVTNPFQGDGPTAPYAGDAYRSKHVGDVFDTSPYDPADPPAIAPYVKREQPQAITVSSFVSNMGKLIAYTAPVQA
jgi:hypothetical protein